MAGIDAHKQVFSVAVLDGRGGRCAVASFATSPEGLTEALALLDSFAFKIGRVGVEGSAGLGRHVTQALVAAGYDVREVQANRTVERRRRRRRHKTDREDAEAIARETLADPDLPSAGKQRGPDPAWEEPVAVRNRRKSLIGQRVRLLNEAEAVLTSLPLPVRAALPQTSRVRPRLRALEHGQVSSVQLTAADRANLAWLTETAADIGRLDARVAELDKKIPPLLGRLGSTLTHEHGIAAVGAMDLLVEVGDPTRFATEAQFARWCGAAPVAVSSGEGDQAPTHHRLDLAGNQRLPDAAIGTGHQNCSVCDCHYTLPCRWCTASQSPLLEVVIRRTAAIHRPPRKLHLAQAPPCSGLDSGRVGGAQRGVRPRRRDLAHRLLLRRRWIPARARITITMTMQMSSPRPVVHLELHTGDQARASAFYANLLGWRRQLIQAGCGSYLALDLGGGFGGGIVECGTARPLWLPYVEVDQIEAATEHARQLGASVLLTPREGPAGWRSVISAPQCGELALWQPKR